jgi:hypothetical protein
VRSALLWFACGIALACGALEWWIAGQPLAAASGALAAGVAIALTVRSTPIRRQVWFWPAPRAQRPGWQRPDRTDGT